MSLFLNIELCTPKLDDLHHHLWLAGLPVPARSLSRQRLMGRIILVTERPDEHLVWHDGEMYLKPLPDYLLCHDFWKEHLDDKDSKVYASAAGLLLSYAWLIQHRSDFAIAKELTLLPEGFEFSTWTAFMSDFISNIDLQTMAQVDRRYKFGELRLSRLNSLTRLRNLLFGQITLSGGHMNFPKRYTTFFKTRFGWLLAAFAYISVILSTLQVGLGTALEESFAFQRLSYVITIGSLVVAFGSSLSVFIVWLVLFVFHVLSARSFSRRIKAQREFCQSPAA
ncbi:hypothetical protein N0V82_001267 [Gnomoniopsis sp. IMI 355080]|nr:hypothetical protein N0V82_001267 [Gnomoniopsis sp. IMI 355080]